MLKGWGSIWGVLRIPLVFVILFPSPLSRAPPALRSHPPSIWLQAVCRDVKPTPTNPDGTLHHSLHQPTQTNPPAGVLHRLRTFVKAGRGATSHPPTRPTTNHPVPDYPTLPPLPEAASDRPAGAEDVRRRRRRARQHASAAPTYGVRLQRQSAAREVGACTSRRSGTSGREGVMGGALMGRGMEEGRTRGSASRGGGGGE